MKFAETCVLTHLDLFAVPRKNLWYSESYCRVHACDVFERDRCHVTPKNVRRPKPPLPSRLARRQMHRQCVSWRFWDTLHQLCIDQSQTCACTRRRWRPQRLSLNRCYEVRSSCQVRTSWSTVLRSPDVDAATAHFLHRLLLRRQHTAKCASRLASGCCHVLKGSSPPHLQASLSLHRLCWL